MLTRHRRLLLATAGLLAALAAPSATVAQAQKALDISSDRRLVQMMNDYNEALMAKDLDAARKIAAELNNSHPDVYSFKLLAIDNLINTGRHRTALKTIENFEAESALEDRTPGQLQEIKARALLGMGDRKGALKCAQKALQVSPCNKRLLEDLTRLNQSLRSPELAALIFRYDKAADLQIASINKKLAAIKPSGTTPINTKCGAEAILRAACFPSFKLKLTSENLLGDSGVVRYLISKPDFKTICMIDDDSKNYVSMTLPQLMRDHCGKSTQRCYSSLTEIGSETINNVRCVKYKAVSASDWGYDIIAVASNLAVPEPLADCVARLCLLPRTGTLPVSVVNYRNGLKISKVQISSLRLSHMNTDDFKPPAGYTRVPSKGELIYSEGGRLQKRDVDREARNPQKSRK